MLAEGWDRATVRPGIPRGRHVYQLLRSSVVPNGTERSTLTVKSPGPLRVTRMPQRDDLALCDRVWTASSNALSIEVRLATFTVIDSGL